jgi:sulfotransferase
MRAVALRTIVFMSNLNGRIFFVSGLPRSGSTLLTAILRQNPEFHSEPHSPLAPLATGLLTGMSAQVEQFMLLSDETRERLVRSLFESFYVNEKRTIFDVSRLWCAKLPLLMTLFPETKIIACVRDPVWIIDSFERLSRANPFLHSKLFGPNDHTVHARAERLIGAEGGFHFAWTALLDACASEHSSKMMLVDYDLFAKEPENALKAIYKFLDLPYFQHNFEYVEFSGLDQFDQSMGVPLHRIRSKVEYIPRETILPKDLVDRLSGMCFWRQQDAESV